MSFSYQFEPLTAWPLPPTKPRRSPQFRTSYDRTLRQLTVELDHLKARGAVAIQVVTGNGSADLRKDGMLASRAKVIHPGVRISFESMFGPLTYASDAFEGAYYGQPPDWQANLRAIVLGLEALRAVDRYGITRSGEQYRGWQALASSTGSSAGMSRDVALSVLREEAHSPIASGTPADVRMAKLNAHPDRNDGRRERWDALMAALEALGLGDL